MNEPRGETPTPSPKVESKQVFTRQEVLQAFDSSYAAFSKSVEPLLNRSSNDLTPDERKRLADYRNTTNGVEKAKGSGKKIPINWENQGQEYSSQEGIPIEGVLDFLQTKIATLYEERRNGADMNARMEIDREIKEYQKNLEILEKNSLSYDEARKRQKKLRQVDFQHARTSLEAMVRSQDELRKSENPEDKTRMEEDWANAEVDLKHRRELIIPREKKAQIEPEVQPPSNKPLEVIPPPRPDVEQPQPTVEVSARVHRPPFLIDNLHNPAGEVDLSQARDKLGKEMVAVENFLTEEVNGQRQVKEGLRQLIPRQPGKSDSQYQDQLVQEMARRLRFQGDYEKTDDPLYRQMRQAGLISEDRSDKLLMASEALHLLHLQTENQRMLQEASQIRAGLGRYEITTQEQEGAGLMRLSGGDLIFDFETEPGKPGVQRRKEIPDRDLFAQAILGETLMDIPYQSKPDGSTLTFRQMQEDLNQQRRQARADNDRTKFDELTRKASLARQKFYDEMKTVLAKRRLPANPFPAEQLFMREAFGKVKELTDSARTPNMLDTLLTHYFSKHPNIKPDKQAELKTKLIKLFDIREGEQTIANFLVYAHEGADFMERKSKGALVKPELHKIPKKIRSKIFTKVGPYVDVPHDYEEATPTIRPPVKPPITPEPGPPGPGPRREGEPLPVAPVPGEDGKKPSTTPEPAPTGPKPEEKPLERNFNLAFAGDMTQEEKEVVGGVDFQLQLAQKERKGIGGFFKTLTAGVWQNTLFQPVFRERENRWRRTAMEQTHLSHLPNQLVEEAMKQGKIKADKRNIFRRIFADSWFNFGKQMFGGDTTSRIEAKKWLVDQVNLARQRSDRADVKVKGVLNAGLDEKEAFGARLAIDSDIVLHKGDKRDVLAEKNLQGQLVGDFFSLLHPYISGQQSDEWAKEQIDKYCSEKDASKAGLAKVLGDRYKGLVDPSTVVGSNMRRIAKYLRDNRERFVTEGIVKNADDPNSWLEAYNSAAPEKKINFKIFVAQAEISEAGDVGKKKREKAATLLAERSKGRLEKLCGPGVRWAIRFLPSTFINEVTVAGYVGSLANALIPTSPQKARMLGGALGIPLIVAGTAGAPVLIPLAAGAAAAGVYAGVREAIRLGKERRSIEREASFNILPSDTIKLNGLSRFLGVIYGRTGRQEIVGAGTKEKPGYIVNQRAASELAHGLTKSSGLFADPENLTSALPENVTVEQARQALHFMAEAKARIDLTAETNRRFIRYDSGKMGEAQQQEVLDGATKEVYERLNFLFGRRSDLKAEFFKHGVTNFGQLYDRLVSAYQYNLTGDKKQMTPELVQLANLLGTDDAKGFIEERRSMLNRDRAFKKLQLIKGGHRALGTAASAFVTGEALAAVKHFASGTPPPWPWREHLPGPPRIDNSPPLPDSQWHDKLNVGLPPGFRAIDDQTFVDNHGATHSWSQMEAVDANHDGVLGAGEAMLLRDKISHEVLFSLTSSPAKDAVEGGVDIFKPEFGADGQPKVQGIDLDHNGVVDVQVKIPDNTGWVENRDGTWDLKALDSSGKPTVTLIDDATIKPDGHITGVDHSGNLVEFTSDHQVSIGSGTQTVEKPISDLTTVVDQVHIPPEGRHFYDFYYKSGDGYGVVFQLRGNQITGQGASFANVEEAAKSGQMVFSLWKLNPNDAHHPEMIQIKVDPNNVESFSDSANHHVADLDNGFTVGHDPNGSFVTFKLDPNDTSTQYEIVDSTGNSLGKVSGAELYSKLVNEDALEQQISLHPERGADHGDLFSNETVEGRNVYDSERISWGVNHNGQNLTLTTIAGHKGMEGEISVIEIGKEEKLIPELSIDVGPVSERGLEKLGYDLTREISTVPGEFSAGVLPTPFTSYAEVGQVPEATRPPTTAAQGGPQPATTRVPPSPEERGQLEARHQELIERKKRLEEAIESAKKSAPAQKPTSEQEAELAKIDEELQKLDAQLSAQISAPKSKEGPMFDFKKVDYEAAKDDLTKLLSDTNIDLNSINQELAKRGVPPINQKDLDDIRSDPEAMKLKVINIILGQIQKEITASVMMKDNGKEVNETYQQELDKLPDKVKSKVKALDDFTQKILQLRQEITKLPDGKDKDKLLGDLEKANKDADAILKGDPSIEQQILDLRRRVRGIFVTRHKDEIDAETARIRKQIEEWETAVAAPHEEQTVGKERIIGPYRLGEASDKGKVRDYNQDVTAIDELTDLDDKIHEVVMILADGSGGSANGLAAAQKAIAVFKEEYHKGRKTLAETDAAKKKEAIKRIMREAVIKTNEAVFAIDQGGSYTTFVASVLQEDGSYIGVNIGDSRGYEIDDQEAKRVTVDHSLGQRMINIGQLTQSDLYTFPQRNVIYRAVGKTPQEFSGYFDQTSEDAAPNFFEGQLTAGKQLLLCSDGLWEMTKDPDGSVIRGIARKKKGQQEIAEDLIQKANDEGGEDNVSVLIASRQS